MCGLCGVHATGEAPRPGAGQLAEMLATIRHRGPDDDGMYVNGEIGLASARLSILDVERGHQPMTNEDGRIVVVFNGEIYNFRELAAGLVDRGHRLRTSSDTEVIAHLYEERGEDLVHELRGMFAFALWDVGAKRLLLARDRLGIKPLYYAQRGGLLVFGSEIKALLRHPAVVARHDLSALSHFLSLRYVPAPDTMFEGVAALPPGHLLTHDADGARTRAYWDLSFASNGQPGLSEGDLTERVAELLTDAVESHLVSDVPVGAFLSGGLDSSCIVSLMSMLRQERIKTFSVGFDDRGQGLNELPHARRVAEHVGSDHHEVIVGPQHVIELAEKVVWHLDQPIADQASFANYLLAEAASREVKVVLTGEGSDEIFAGYARYKGERFAPLARWMPPRLGSLLVAASGRLPGLERPKIALYALAQRDESRRLSNWFSLYNDDLKAALLSAEIGSEAAGVETAQVFARHLEQTDATQALNRMLYVDTKLWLPDDLLARGDKTAMAASLEARVPFLDHHLVEFAATLPTALKLRRSTSKYVLKEVAQRWLPPEIVHRKKAGFPIPLGSWFRNEARAFVHDHLSPSTVRRRGLFDPATVEQLLAEHDSGRVNRANQIWGLLNVELWQRAFIDAPATTGDSGARARSVSSLSSARLQ